MREFIREFWLWILVPFVVVIGGLALLVAMSGGDASGDFVYNVFGN